MTPSAVQLIASEIPSARIRAFCEGSMLSPPTAPNAFTRPTVVPSKPTIVDPASTTATTLVRNDDPPRFQSRRNQRAVRAAPTKPATSHANNNHRAAIERQYRMMPATNAGAYAALSSQARYHEVTGGHLVF